MWAALYVGDHGSQLQQQCAFLCVCPYLDYVLLPKTNYVRQLREDGYWFRYQSKSVCMWVCMCVRECVPYGAVVCAVSPIERLRVQVSFFKLFFHSPGWVTNSQRMPEYNYGVACVCLIAAKWTATKQITHWMLSDL